MSDPPPSESAPRPAEPEASSNNDEIEPSGSADATTTASTTTASGATATSSSADDSGAAASAAVNGPKKKKKHKKKQTGSGGQQQQAEAAEHKSEREPENKESQHDVIDVSTPAAAASSSSSSSSSLAAASKSLTKASNSSSKPLTSPAASSSSASSSAANASMLALLTQSISSLSTRAAGGPGAGTADHKFWSTQPVPQLTESSPSALSGPIETKTVASVATSPYPLPPGFSWSSVDMRDAVEAGEVYRLLSENYVEDDDNMFRFDYSAAFLQWALMPPHWSRDFHIGVRLQQQSSHRLVAFISGIPQRMRVYTQAMQMVEINFLCVHKKLRSKRLAPVLIKEVTRRVNLSGVWQAVYTAGVLLPRPVSSTRYWHRSLQVKKLIDVRFTRLQRNMTLMRSIKLYRVPEQPQLAGIRQMEEADVSQVHRLLNAYLGKFQLVPVMSEDEVRHWLLPRTDVVYCYVVVTQGKVTDFCSFYSLPSSVIGHPQHKTLKAAYSFYNVATAHGMQDVMQDALTFAWKEGFDVFNALDVMDNSTVLEKLKFGPGDGQLQYYLYNWRCPEMRPEQVGLVLL